MGEIVADNTADCARRVERMRQVLALFGLALCGATWRLWIPEDVFPRVPLIWAAVYLPEWGQWSAALALSVGLCLAAWPKPTNPTVRVGLRIFAAALAVLMLADQHRIQPWAYQALLIALVLANAPPQRACIWLRWLTASIYFYSGWSKFDYEFLHSVGQQLLSTLFGLTGFDVTSWPSGLRLWGAAAFPAAEWLIGVGLLLPRTRRAALAGSLGLHAMLLVLLGPWGLRHSLAVLLWNAFFMAQNVVLFGRTSAATRSAAHDQEAPLLLPRGPSRYPWVTAALLYSALVLPALEPWGWFDAWPSWSLYAPNSERATLYVHRSSLGRLGSLAEFAPVAEDDDEEWVRLRLDRWSLAALAAPVYPQNRFQLGVALAVGERLGPEHRLRLVLWERAARVSGHREHRTLTGVAEMGSAADRYWLNARPDPRSW